ESGLIEEAPVDPRFPFVAPRSDFVPIYVPGTPIRAESRILRVAGGDELASHDILLRPVTATIVRGIVTPPVPAGVSLRIELSAVDGDRFTRLSTPESDGRFLFRGIP